MNKTHIITIIVAALVLAAIYFLAPTVNPKREAPAPAADEHAHEMPAMVQIDSVENRVVASLNPAQRQTWQMSKALLDRGTHTDSLLGLQQLTGFYRDSFSNALLHFNYLADHAALENTEKSLTFAGHSILTYLPYVQQPAEQNWLANRSNQLFEKALAINPANDSSKVGLGGTIMFGAGDQSQAMSGITSVLEVARKDSNFLFAQYMLGVGGMLSGQYDRAAERFERVAELQPNNLEVKFKTAEAYEQAGKNQKALEWYEDIARHVRQPELLQAVNERIQHLKSGQ